MSTTSPDRRGFRCAAGTCLAAAIITIIPPAVTAVAQPNNAFLGMNLDQMANFTRQWVFTDVALQSRAPNPVEDGWMDFSTYLSTPSIPVGQYTAIWQGSGEVSFDVGANAASEISRNGTTAILDVDPAGANGIRWKTRGDVQNLSIHMPGFAPGQANAGQKFHPTFVQRLQPFSNIRYMGWQRTNEEGGRNVDFSELPAPNSPQSVANGVHPQHMVDLSNEVGADPWVTMPHTASDDYVRQYAEMFRDNLDPGLKVYVEYSNELWNATFVQAQWIEQQAIARGYETGSGDPDSKRVWGEEARNDFGIWHEVFAGQTDRVVRVIAGQEVNPWVTERLLEYMGDDFDAIATTAYFGHEVGRDGHEVSTLDDVFREANIELERQRSHRLAHAEIADEESARLGRDIQFLTYESGQHLRAAGGAHGELTDLLIAANRDPRMFDLIQRNMRILEETGGDLYQAFQFVSAFTNFGSWGHLEHQDQDIADAHKYRALIDFVGGIVLGDANQDGVLSSDDLLAIQLNFGSTGPPGLIPGDGNFDGVVSAADIITYHQGAAHFGTPSPDALSATNPFIPEPAGAAATMMLLAPTLRRRRGQ